MAWHAKSEKIKSENGGISAYRKRKASKIIEKQRNEMAKNAISRWRNEMAWRSIGVIRRKNGRKASK
jgi:hypothetical protein